MPSFDDYNKISDVMLHLTSDTTFKVNVAIKWIGPDKTKRSFHREVQTNNGIKITRDFSYYYTIEKSGDNFDSIMIRVQDMILLRRLANKALEWFDGNNVFMIKDKKLIAMPEKPIVLSGLAGNKILRFDPIVYQYDESSPVAPGVRLSIGSLDVFTDIDVNKFFGFVYLLENDMFARAQNLIQYLGRPEFGTNLYMMEAFSNNPNNTNPLYKKPAESSITTKRRISNIDRIKPTKSFFDVGDE